MGGKNGLQPFSWLDGARALSQVIESRLAAGESGEIMGAAGNSGQDIARPRLPIFNRPLVLKPFRQDRPERDVTSDIGTRADDNRQRCPRKDKFGNVPFGAGRDNWPKMQQMQKIAILNPPSGTMIALCGRSSPSVRRCGGARRIWKDMKLTIEFVPWLRLS